MTDPSTTITTEIRGHVLLIGLNRPQKLNAFNEEMLRALSRAYTRYEADDALRCAVLFAAGKDFTAGLDLASVMPGIEAGGPLWPCEGIDPLADQRARADQAGRGGPAGAGLHGRHRARARERHPPLLRRRDLRPARDRARYLPVRRRDVPRGRAARLGQRDALPAHRGAVRRGRGAAHRARCGGHAQGRSARQGDRDRGEDRQPRRRSACGRRSRRPAKASPRETRRRRGRFPGSSRLSSRATTPARACSRSWSGGPGGTPGSDAGRYFSVSGAPPSSIDPYVSRRRVLRNFPVEVRGICSTKT